MKRTLLLLLSFTPLFLNAQILQTCYSNDAGTSLAEYNVVDVVQTMDNGFLNLSFNVPGNTFNMTKLDANGNVVWQSEHTSGTGAITGSIEEHSNGNIIVAYSSFGAFLRVHYFDALGNALWTRQIVKTGDLVMSDKVGVTVDETQTFPEFIVYGGAGSQKLPYFTRIGNTGASIWHRTYNDLFGGMFDVTVNDAIVASTGITYAVATSPSENYVMRIDNAGNLTVLKATSLKLNKVIEVNGGDIMAVGSVTDVFGNEDAAYLMMDANTLDEVENGSFGSSNSETATSVFQNADNTFVLGVADNSTGITKMGLYKLNGANALEFSKAYGGNGVDIPQGVFQKADGGFVLIGSSNSFSPSADMFVVMTDDQGLTVGCQEDLAYTVSTNNPFTYTNFISSVISPAYSNTSSTVTPQAEAFSIITPYPTTTLLESHPACFGGTGSADLSVSGGVVPYSYAWSSGTFAEDLINVLEGTYSVTIADANGCLVHDTTTLVQPTEITSSAGASDVSCAGASDGSVDLSVAGGTPGYTYLWTYNAQSSEDLSGIPGGFYQVTITDANGCTKNEFISVSEPTPLVAGMQATSDPTCHDLCDGVIDGIASGGTAPYTYLWNDPGVQTTATATSLCAGSFLLTVTDANGCTTIANASLANPDELTTTVNTTPSECGLTSGTAMATPSGGTMPYSYNWPLGSTVDNESGLDVGAYAVTVVDANGCVINESFNIDAFVAPVDICLITVDSTSTFNQIVWEKPVANNIEGFKVYRNVAGSYDEIGFVPYADLSAFDDQTFGVDPNVTSYRYKISVVDTCGNESDLSDYHETIHLTVTEGLGGEVNCIWDNYEGFPFTEYNILKDTTDNGIDDWFVDDQVSNISFTWTDLDPEAFVRYTIQVNPQDSCTATNKAQDYNSSRSNRGVTAGGGGSSSIAELEAISGLNLFPNPNNGDFNLSLYITESGLYNFQIMDVQGKIVSSFQEQLGLGSTTLELSNLELEKGVYLLRLNGDTDSESVKFTVLR